MFGAPSNVPLMGCRALIAPVSYVQWLQEVVGGLSIPHRARGVKRRGASGATSAVVVFWGEGGHAGDRVIIKFKKEGEVLVAEEVRKLR